ncbi:MAG: hypothetical protein G01um101493_395 [Microgenomates group bacterium Gr01-1014_93]|nr:MAG: hypothetical protein G01um101493_395 [Microgenomates group bacterium Gr01-1014_93]
MQGFLDEYRREYSLSVTHGTAMSLQEAMNLADHTAKAEVWGKVLDRLGFGEQTSEIRNEINRPRNQV